MDTIIIIIHVRAMSTARWDSLGINMGCLRRSDRLKFWRRPLTRITQSEFTNGEKRANRFWRTFSTLFRLLSTSGRKHLCALLTTVHIAECNSVCFKTRCWSPYDILKWNKTFEELRLSFGQRRRNTRTTQLVPRFATISTPTVLQVTDPKLTCRYPSANCWGMKIKV